jgi:hypothetical protein
MSNPKNRNENMICQELFDETLIYDMKIDKVYCLNHSLAVVYNACDGEKSLEDLQTFVSEKLEIPITKEFVLLSLNQLSESGLLDDYEKLNEHHNFAAMSRRDLVKKAGLATVAALPAISVLIAPEAAAAASGSTCVPYGQHCNSAAECCPNVPNCQGFCF